MTAFDPAIVREAWRIRQLEEHLAVEATWTLHESWHAWKGEERQTAWKGRGRENGFRLIGNDHETALDLSWWQFEIVMRNYGHVLDWTGSPYAGAHRQYLEDALYDVDKRVARGEVQPPDGSRVSWSADPVAGSVMSTVNPPADWTLPGRPVASQFDDKLGWRYERGRWPDAVGWLVATS